MHRPPLASSSPVLECQAEKKERMRGRVVILLCAVIGMAVYFESARHAAPYCWVSCLEGTCRPAHGRDVFAPHGRRRVIIRSTCAEV